MIFPDEIQIEIKDKKTGMPITNIALMLHLYANRKNDYYILLPNSDEHGMVIVRKEFVKREIQLDQNLFIMDYASDLEDCKPFGTLEVISDEQIYNMYNTLFKKYVTNNYPERNLQSGTAENYKVDAGEFPIGFTEGIDIQKVSLFLKTKNPNSYKAFEKEFEEDKIFVLAEYGTIDEFRAGFHSEVLNRKSRFGISLLHAAVAGGNEDIIDFLLDSNIDVNLSNEKGETPLHYISYYPSVSIAKKLIEHGGDINAKDMNGNSAFLKAIIYARENHELIETLFGYSPDLGPNNGGITPLKLAQFEQDKYLENLIKERIS